MDSINLPVLLRHVSFIESDGSRRAVKGSSNLCSCSCLTSSVLSSLTSFSRAQIREAAVAKLLSKTTEHCFVLEGFKAFLADVIFRADGGIMEITDLNYVRMAMNMHNSNNTNE